MKSTATFLLYFFLGFFLIFTYKEIKQTLNSQQLKSPLPQSSFSINVAPSNSLRGTIVSLSGDVGCQSRIATQPAQITKPMQIQQGEKIKTLEKGQATVIFANAINLTIYPKTEIDFIQTLPSNILIGQNSGTAQYSKSGNKSLSVKCLDLLIKINQGEIGISVNETQPYITVDIKNGSITIGYNDINYVTKTLNVAGNKRLIFRTDTKKISLISI